MNVRPASRITLKLRDRVLLLFGACTMVVIAAAAFGFWQFFIDLRTFDRDVMRDQANAIGVESLETDFKKQVQEWKDTLLRGKNPEALDKHWTAFQQREGDVRAGAARMEENIADAEASRLVAEFFSAHKAMGDAYRRGLQAFKDHDYDSSVGDKAVAGIDRAPTELLGKTKERLLSLASAKASEARASVQRTAWTTALLLALSAVAGAAVFWTAVQTRISGPLTRAVDSLTELARGNTAIDVRGSSRGDEIGQVVEALQRLQERMVEADRIKTEQATAEERMVERRKAEMARIASEFETAVGEIVKVVSSASSELEASARTLAGTAEQAEALTTTVATASEEASSNVRSVAASTEELSSSVNEISRQVQESAQMAGVAVDQARTTTARVSELSQVAATIGDVVELINAIAGQTNLLALNATIEAARAGEAGRGFAVVATEVKALAEQTAKATGEIGKQISGIQAATRDSVTAITEISGSIKKLSDVSSSIAAAVEEQGVATREISRSVQQAARGTDRVSATIGDVRRGAGKTGAASSQVLSAARALAQESNRLKLEVANFLATVLAA